MRPQSRGRVTALGNAGFLVSSGTTDIYLDPFVSENPNLKPMPVAGSGRSSLILITHKHWDHFHVQALTEAAGQGAVIVGPDPVARRLQGKVPARSLIRLEPQKVGSTASATVDGMEIRAFRTRHGQAHNSYRVDMPGFRLFDDGDNEHTECIDQTALTGLDALFLCPWQGSGWVEFIEAIRPAHWFLMHMTDEEFDAHERSEFLPELCDHIPMDPVALRPGESFDVPGKDAAR